MSRNYWIRQLFALVVIAAAIVVSLRDGSAPSLAFTLGAIMLVWSSALLIGRELRARPRTRRSGDTDAHSP